MPLPAGIGREQPRTRYGARERDVRSVYHHVRADAEQRAEPDHLTGRGRGERGVQARLVGDDDGGGRGTGRGAAHRERRRGGEPRRERALRVGAARVERGDDEHSGYGMKAHRVSSRGAPGHSPAAGGYGGSRDRRSVGKRRWSDGERPHARTQSAWRREDVCRFGTRQPPSAGPLEFCLRPAGERRLMNSVFASAVWLFGYAFLSNVALARSEEHTSELQSHSDLVCRLLLEKKKKTHMA